MKIASAGTTKRLCQYLMHLHDMAHIPPLVIGRIGQGPCKWFNYRADNTLSVSNGWEAEYYRIISTLRRKTSVEHFVVCPTYVLENGPPIQLTSAMFVTATNVVHTPLGEARKVTHITSPYQCQGDLCEAKLVWWLHNWEETKQCFHAANYVLWSEPTPPSTPTLTDNLFHYSGHGMSGECERQRKVMSTVRESFVMEQKNANLLNKMFHDIYDNGLFPSVDIEMVI